MVERTIIADVVIALVGSVLVFLLYMVAMQVPFMRQILRVGPFDFVTFVSLLGLALTIFMAMEIHKWWWNIRRIG